MSDRPWWLLLLKGAIGGLVILLVTRWLANARRPATKTEWSSVLAYPKAILVVGIACSAPFVALAIVSAFFVSAEEWWVPYLLLGLALVGAPLAGEALRVRHELTNEGIAYRGFWTEYAMVYWMEIESARWSHSLKWLAVTTRDRRVLLFSGLLNGFDALAQVLNERVPRLAADEATAAILADARRGRLPTIWE